MEAGMFNRFWGKLSPGQRRYAVIGAILVVIGLLIAIASPSTEERKSSEENVIKHVLTDINTRSVGVDALAARVERLSRSNEDLRREQERLQTELGRRGEQNPETIALREELKVVRQQMAALERATKDAPTQQVPEVAEPKRAEEPSATMAGAIEPVLDPEQVFKEAAELPVMDGGPRSADGRRADKASGIVTVVEDKKEVAPDEEQKDRSPHLPAGSIISAVVIAGMDAPTGQGARRDPFPALLRIKHEAVLPNRFRQDIRECFLTASGYGDLSSERAYLRAETISCVRNDGSVIEKRVEAFASGEDGKAGLRGRLVSRQSQLIARSMMAGFMQGVSEMFTSQRVPTLNLNGDGTAAYEQLFNGTALQSGALMGAGRALERISDYYMSMAEGMYPIIEIDAGRAVDFIVQRGVTLNAN
jgi:conjugal transfer pilus assembly protein TraB